MPCLAALGIVDPAQMSEVAGCSLRHGDSFLFFFGWFAFELDVLEVILCRLESLCLFGFVCVSTFQGMSMEKTFRQFC